MLEITEIEVHGLMLLGMILVGSGFIFFNIYKSPEQRLAEEEAKAKN
jgi:hypothetical protein